jgi:UDP-sugar transporter A1/2/3
MNAKYLSLLAGIFQQTALVLIIRYSKISHSKDDSPPYLTSVAVAASEVLKMLLALVLEGKGVMKKQQEESLPLQKDTDNGISSEHSRTVLQIWKDMVRKVATKEGMKLIIPAVLYLIQNNLIFLALSNLSVPVYQVTNQGKLLTTAILSRIFLKKNIKYSQYAAITLLGLGVAVTNLSDANVHKSHPLAETNQKPLVGLVAMLICCMTSSLAGVYFEYVLKKSNAPSESVHTRNFQLSSWSLLFALILIISKDIDFIKQYGMFHGFDFIVVLVVIAQALVGFVVSLMLLYANAVLKGFAIAIAAVLSSILSVFLFRTTLTSEFYVGALMVMVSVKLYSHFEAHDTMSKKQKFGTGVTFTIIAFLVYYEVAKDLL